MKKYLLCGLLTLSACVGGGNSQEEECRDNTLIESMMEKWDRQLGDIKEFYLTEDVIGYPEIQGSPTYEGLEKWASHPVVINKRGMALQCNSNPYKFSCHLAELGKDREGNYFIKNYPRGELGGFISASTSSAKLAARHFPSLYESTYFRLDQTGAECEINNQSACNQVYCGEAIGKFFYDGQEALDYIQKELE